MREDLHSSIARQLWRAIAESDSDGIRELLSPNVVWSTRSSGALNGSIEGPDAVIDRLERKSSSHHVNPGATRRRGENDPGQLGELK